MWNRLWHFYQFKRPEFLEHYHRRSNVETTFSMIKGKLGKALRSKTLVAQTNEILCKVLAHNICCLIHSMYELGIEATFWGTKKSPAAANTSPLVTDPSAANDDVEPALNPDDSNESQDDGESP